MDPNRFVERMLLHMYNATVAAQNGDNATANEAWQEVTDNLSDYQEWLNKGGFPATLNFNFEILD
jgi:hypothetical protein